MIRLGRTSMLVAALGAAALGLIPLRSARRERPAVRPRPSTAVRAAPAAAAFIGVAASELPEHAAVQSSGGVVWIGANDLARLLGATKFWRPDVRKLELRSPTRRIQLTVDNPFVLVDDRTVAMPAPVRSRAGELRVPVALVDSLPRDSAGVRLAFDPRRMIVLRVPELGLVHRPRIVEWQEGQRIVFPTDRPTEVTVVGRSRPHFRVRFGGLFVGALPETLPGGELVRAMNAIPSVSGSAFELVLSPETRGFRVERDERRGWVALVFTRSNRREFERFAPEGPPGPRPVRVIVLDAGHGGGDAGVSAQGSQEKALALALARELERVLQHRIRARVLLTRTDDRAMSVQERAERANRAHADLVISLHFDGAPGSAARGATAYCPPATYGGADAEGANLGIVMLQPWRDVATRHAVRSRELAEAVLSSIELRGLGPARLREVLPYPLLGVNAPGLLLECATLTSDVDRARVASPDGIPRLAAAIAFGIEAYGRAE